MVKTKFRQIAEEILRNNKHHNSVNMQNTLQQLKYKVVRV